VTASLHNGPGTGYPILGTLPSGAIVKVIGRSDDSTWLQVVSQVGITGWLPAAVVEVNGDIAQLAVGAPGPGPSIAVPTQSLSDLAPPVPTRIVPAEDDGPGERRPTERAPTPRRTPTPRPTTPPPPPPTLTPVVPPPTPIPQPNP
jgi:uncharacterized protein YraI